ncbi:choice-of-anchor B family protein [Nitriliruptor alkaliphilus]|uniref:choice-of-anchor B family protein n=1 Tax=Nitriliruptor alkaliphilus TaxID=427918 RepID=UPI0006984726|nr:choice-of-anchor B family protein [Nitriliruptor alkaliphilus]
MSRTLQRPISIGLTIAMALALAVLSPKPAHAHDSCAIAQPAATGLLGSVLAAVNVFASILPTAEAACPDKYEGVDVKLTRDWLDEDEEEAGEAAGPRSNASKANPNSDAPPTFAPCRNGMAADFFPCDGVDMLSHVSHAELGTVFVNDIWGWTDPQSGKDYALVGSSTGTVFVDISDAKRPDVLGKLPTASTFGGSSWRDIKVYADHAYVVSEHTNHGVQVFDLTRLRDWDGTYTTYDMDAWYTGHGSAHNININEDTGFLYSVGAGPFGAPYEVTVDEPSSAAGVYDAAGASFGPAPTEEGLTGDFAIVDAESGLGSEGCDVLVDFPAGAIAIADRGGCVFTEKAKNAQDAGAIAIVIVDNQPGPPANLGGTDDSITIPAVRVSQHDGAIIKDGLDASGGISAKDETGPDCGTGLHMIDINDPKDPTYAGCFDDHGYIHDTQCVVYDGPDANYQGREICFNSNGIAYELEGRNYVSIVDVTDKSNPVSLSRLEYDGSGYSHQGWLTEDKRWFLHGDEGDEFLAGVNTTTRVWDVSDLTAPFVHQVFVNDTTSIDHNLYTKGDRVYASNYTTGLRIYDASDIAGAGISEIAYFDVYPENDNPTFEGGTWSNYPYFSQENVVAVGSIDRGLFILKPRGGRG